MLQEAAMYFFIPSLPGGTCVVLGMWLIILQQKRANKMVNSQSQVWWCTPVIPATREAEIRKIVA
jgi:hypothetical protein